MTNGTVKVDHGRLVLSLVAGGGAVALASAAASPLLWVIAPKWWIVGFLPVAVFVGFPIADRVYYRRDRFKFRLRYEFMILGAECEVDTLTFSLVLVCLFAGLSTFFWP